jgi:nucleotide-binding universal stress UspA family protein
MKTVLVPVDFSDTSYGTARYAVNMLSGRPEVDLILFHVFEKANEEGDANSRLESLKSQLITENSMQISTHAELNDNFPDALCRFARHRSANLIVMGLTGKSRLQQIFLTGNTLKIVEMNPCPVMVIPPSAEFKNGIHNVALTSDFKDVEKTTPVQPIKEILQLLKPNLHIVNVNSDHYVSLTEAYLAERKKMAELFAEFNPEFFFIGTFDFHETINRFVVDKNIDMVITIPRSHSFIENLFKPSHTKKLVFESTVPILAAHA